MGKLPTPSSVLQLRLYVAGGAPNSILAIANAKAICEEYFQARHEMEVVDLLTQPLRALADGIIVTPTLLKLSPLPSRRVIGNLNDRAQLLHALGPT